MGWFVNKLKGLMFFILLFFSSLWGALVFGGFLLPVFFIRPALYRHLYDYMIGLWLWFAAALVEKLIGLNVTICGDTMRANEPSIIIMNHRTRLDWMYFWCVLVRQPSGVMTEKIILKSTLKHIPGPGWAMQVAGFLFVDRRWETDRPYLDAMLSYYSNLKYTPQFLLFPEGTDYDNRTRARSDAFAAKNGLKSYTHVLHPRTTGFAYLASNIQQKWPGAAVYDVTIAYPGSFPQTERQLVAGNLPDGVSFHIKRYVLSADVPDSSHGAETWLRSRWDEKEQRIEQFHSSSGRFVGEPFQAQTDLTDWVPVYYYLSMAFWFVFMLLVAFIYAVNTTIWWISVALAVFFVVMGYLYNGFDYFQAKYSTS